MGRVAMDMQLGGKRALVTGSSSGIGVGIARTLAAEGAQVVVHGRDVGRLEAVAAEIRDAGGEVAVAAGDLESDEGAASVARAATAAFGGIDILVNNAGGRRPGASNVWLDLTIQDWIDAYNMNVLSAVRMVQALAPAMKARGWGRIVNISSIVARSTTDSGEYGAAKGAINNLTVGLVRMLSRTGVTANTVSPGMIRTPALDRMLAKVAAREGLGEDLDAAIRWMLANSMQQAVDRIGLPEDIGYAVAFLASPRGGFINGANIRVDGGVAPSVH